MEFSKGQSNCLQNCFGPSDQHNKKEYLAYFYATRRDEVVLIFCLIHRVFYSFFPLPRLGQLPLVRVRFQRSETPVFETA